MRLKHLKVAAFIVSVLLGTSAQALAPCNQVVVDTANVLKNVPAVQAAAASLAQKTGSEVRVRIAPDHAPQSNLDRHVNAIADSVCDAWTNTDGSRRSNLIIFWVTMNRQVGLYYGHRWEAELARAWPLILENRLKPLLRDSNFDQAFIIAMEEATRVITAAARSATSTPVESGVVRVEPRESVDWAPVVWVVGGVAGLIFLFAVGYFGLLPAWRWFERNRGMREEARGVLAKCYQAFDHLNAFTDRLVKFLDNDGMVKPTPDWTTDEQFSAWHHQLLLLVQQAKGANTAFLSLEEGPMREAGTYEEYRKNRDNLLVTLHELEAVAQAFAALENAIKDEERIANEIQSYATTVTIANNRLTEALASAAQTGFSVEFTQRDAQHAARQCADAEQLSVQKRYREAAALYQNAAATYEKLAESVIDLPKRRDALRASWERVTSERHKLTGKVPEVRSVLESIEQHFARVSYESVVGNGTEAEKRLKAVPNMAKAIGGLLEAQSWDEAEVALEDAHAILHEAEELLGAVPAIAERLEGAKRNAHEELKEAERSIEVAYTFYKTNNRYVTQRGVDQLNEAAELCRSARQILADDKPDVLRAYTLAARADDLADNVYNIASSKKEQVERMIRRAERERTEALAELETVERYFRNHRSDISHRAKSSLSSTERLAQQLRSEQDVARVIELVRQLNTSSKSAYQMAEADIAAASSNSTSPNFGGGSSSWGSPSTTTFGGGSSSW